MCGPIGIGLMTAAGSIYSGMAQGAAADGQAAAYKAEKKSMQYQAQSEANAGSYESAIKQDQGARVLGQQITAVAASGIDLASGSGADIITDSASQVNRDVAAIRHNWQDKANLSNYSAKVAKLNAQTASQNGKMARIGGVISGATDMATAIGKISPGTGTSTSFGS